MQRTRRLWHVPRTAVGLVSCDDVKSIQIQIQTYRNALQAAMAALIAKGWSMPYHNEPQSSQTWSDLVGLCADFEMESCWVGLFAGSQFDRGRSLITKLDTWRDWLAKQKGPKGETVAIPEPVPVPQSDVSLLGGAGAVLALVAVILVLHELR